VSAWLEKIASHVLWGDVDGGRAGGLEHPNRARALGDRDVGELDAYQETDLLDSGRPWVVPHGFLTRTGLDRP
jgi:hypothetical protein